MTQDWCSLETAPKGDPVLGWFPDLGAQVMVWAETHWMILGDWLPMFDPTHWMTVPVSLPYPPDTAPKDGTSILAEFEGEGVRVARWGAPEGGIAQWNHGRWLPGVEPLRWDDLPSGPRA